MNRPVLHDHRGGFSVIALLAVACVVAVAAAAGLFAAWALTPSAEQPAAEGSPAQREAEQSRYAYLPFGVTVANLSEGRLTRYVKVNVTLQVEKEDEAEVQSLIGGGKKAVFQDWLLAYLSDKQLDEVKGGAALAKLRRDIQDGFNSILADYGEARVEGVLFTEFNIQ